MTIVNHFYNATTRKYIAIFGTIFNKLVITREDNDGLEEQRIVVPIAYGPYQKFLARITQDPALDAKSAITLPRMSFEIMSMSYDGTRKLGSINKILPSVTNIDGDKRNLRYVPAPYNIEFNLYVMTKYSEDGTKILEQILPFFKPEYTTAANIIDGVDPLDIPLVLNGVTVEDIYEADFDTRRTLMWTLSFTMKGYYFGPLRNRRVIKFVDVRLYQNMTETEVPDATITTQPGLTANNEPTSLITETIPYSDIYADDDWGIITIITENDETT